MMSLPNCYSPCLKQLETGSVPVKVLRDKYGLKFLTVGCWTDLVVNEGPGCNSQTSHELAMEVKDTIAKTQGKEKESNKSFAVQCFFFFCLLVLVMDTKSIFQNLLMKQLKKCSWPLLVRNVQWKVLQTLFFDLFCICEVKVHHKLSMKPQH